MRIDDLETPAVLIDLDRLAENLRRMAAYTKAHGLQLRPHTKTHKIPALARMQMDAGAVGITVAKVGEAEVMRDGGLRDIMVAYPVLGSSKVQRLAALAAEVTVTVSLDSETAARGLSAAAAERGVTFHVLAETDAGFRRCGVPIGDPLVQLARTIMGLPGLHFRGVMYYPGHVWGTPEECERMFGQLKEDAARISAVMERARIPVEVVSGGSTPLAWRSHELQGLTEIRPGTYVFNDRNTVYRGACEWDHCAQTVMVTVVSTAVSGQMMIDGGSKTFCSDTMLAAYGTGFGRIVGDDGAVFTRMNEEHGYVDIRNAQRSYKVGDRLRVIPNHCCGTENMHDLVWGIRGDEVVKEWVVAGRGKIR